LVTIFVKQGTSEHFFSTSHLAKGIRGRSARGVAVTGLAQVVKFTLRFASTALLARLLTPAEYGLVGMTALVVGFAGIFRDSGLASAAIQREHLKPEAASTLFWINVGLGGLLTLILILIAPVVAWFYGDDRLIQVTAALAWTFAISGVMVQHQALLRRQMRFKALAVIEITSLVAGILVAYVMARMGFGYWSLVAMSVSSAVVNVVGVWIAVPWMPSRPRWCPEVGDMVSYGHDVLSVNVMTYFSRNMDNILIAWCWGAVSLGLYEKAYALLLLPIKQINSPMGAVAIPAMARIRSDRVELKRYFLALHHLMACLSVPAIVGIAIFADQVVRLWLGPKWLECAPIFRALSAGALIGAVSSPTGWLLLALGLSRRHRNASFVTVPLVILSFAYGLPYGPVGVAVGYSIMLCLILVPSWAWALHGTGIRVRDMFASMGTPLVSSMVAGAAAVAILAYAPANWGEPYRALLAAGAFGLIYAVMLLGVFRERVLLLKIWHALRSGSRPAVKPEPAGKPA
jgi:O-antigen/teichoic acid export membrane protein